MAREAGTKNEFENDDLYEILEILPSANDDEIKEAYERLARKHHPDKNSETPREGEGIMKRVVNAYRYLINHELRRIYDYHRARKKRADSSQETSDGDGRKKDYSNERGSSSAEKEKQNSSAGSKGSSWGGNYRTGPKVTGSTPREEMDKEINELQRRIKGMERKERGWKLEKEDLLNSRRQHQEDIKTLQNERSGLKEDFIRIKTERDQLKIEKDKLKVQTTKTETEKNEVRQTNIRLEDEGNKIKTSMEKMKSERDTIFTKIAADAKRADSVNAENEKLRTEKEKYLRKILELSAAIETMKQQLNDSKVSLENEKMTNNSLMRAVAQRQGELEEEKEKMRKMTEENIALKKTIEHLTNVELQRAREENRNLIDRIHTLEETIQQREEESARRETEIGAILFQYKAQEELIKRLLDETNKQKLTIDELKQRDQSEYWKTVAEENQAGKDKLADELKTASDSYTRLLRVNKEQQKNFQEQDTGIQGKRTLMKELRELKLRMERVGQTNEDLKEKNKGLLQDLCEKDRQLMWYTINYPFQSPGVDREC